MTEDSDESLLKSFAATRDERAFRQLADRYLGLIFHAAMRRTANRQLAEEISQNILCALAKKASPLARKPELLPAWLHRATLFESSNAMRSESSRLRRKQLAPPAEAAATPSSWAEAIPHLDAALDKLPDSDRRVLLLHYFDDRPFPSIARALGKNPEAVKKQSSRALEKLRRLLLSRGVTVSAVTLASGLSAEFAKAAPAVFLQSAANAVLAGIASYSTTGLTLMTAAKSKALAPIVVLLCLTPLAIQQIAITHSKTRIAALLSQVAIADQSIARPPKRSESRTKKISTNLDILVLADEQDDASRAGGLQQIAFAEKLEALSEVTLVNLIHQGAAIRVQRDKQSGLLRELLIALAAKDARLAVTTAFAAFPADPGLETLIGRTRLADHFGTWADADPSAALAFYREHEKSAEFPTPSRLDAFKAPMIRALAGVNDSEAVGFFQSQTEEGRFDLLGDVLRSNGTRTGKLMPVIREAFPGDARQRAMEILGNSLGFSFSGGDGLSAASDFLAKTELQTAERVAIARGVALRMLNVHRLPPDPERDARIEAGVAAWLQATTPQAAGQIMEEARAAKPADRQH